MSLVRFLRVAEEVGGAPIRLAQLVERVGAETVGELLRGALVERGGVLHDYACGGDPTEGCRREVSAHGRGGELPLVASCGRKAATCASIRLSVRDTEAVRIRLDEIASAVATLFRIPEGPREEVGDGIVRLGIQPRSHWHSRETFLVWRPGDGRLGNFISSRTRPRRGSLVLVPTSQDLSTEVVLRHARGDMKLQVAVISELCDLKDAKLVRRRRETVPKLPRKRRTVAEMFEGQRRTLPVVSDWNDLVFHRPDSERLLLRARGAEMTVTPIDLGMALASGLPMQAFKLLLSVCDEQGWFRGYVKGGEDNKALSRLRGRLKAAFGLTTDPFRDYRSSLGWKARFRATSDPMRARPVKEERRG